MHYELHAESCESYEILRQRLKARGYNNISMGANTMLQMNAYNAGPKIQTNNIKNKPTMIQKRKN